MAGQVAESESEKIEKSEKAIVWLKFYANPIMV